MKPPAEVSAEGPPFTALVGRVPAGVAMTPESLEVNPGFLGFLHDTLAAHGANEPVLGPRRRSSEPAGSTCSTCARRPAIWYIGPDAGRSR